MRKCAFDVLLMVSMCGPAVCQAKSLIPKNNPGSLYVALDSWVYPAFDRLAALGYLSSDFGGMRPWARSECVRLLAEAGRRIGEGESREASQLYRALRQEFAEEEEARWDWQWESVYARGLGITGRPLRDGYHFGQTLVNDFGRPYAEGGNARMGAAVRAAAGPLAFYVRGELQHWPDPEAQPWPALQAMAQADNRPVRGDKHLGTERFRLLDSYVAARFGSTQISFGKHSLWLGPGAGAPWLFSNNAEPIWMLAINRVSPWALPGVERVLGVLRWEFFLGRLAGHEFVFSAPRLYGPQIDPQPFIHGEKISFHPTADFEFGMGVTTVFGGPGMAFTWHNFLRSFSLGIHNAGTAADAGDRRSSFDFSYRVPGLRRRLTVYGDTLVEDEISPIGSSRPSVRLGVYLPQLPGVPKLDFRMEGIYSDVPGQKPSGPIYYNARYRSGYTNYGNLLGSWIGRQGRGGQAWTTYWFTPHDRVQWSYRHMEVDRAFLEGGSLNDFAAGAETALRPELTLAAMVQFERWKFPLLSSHPESNWSVSLGVTFSPQRHMQ